MDANELARQTPLTLYREQIQVLDQIAAEHGIRSRSAAARYIIADWKRLKAAALQAARPLDPASTAQETPA